MSVATTCRRSTLASGASVASARLSPQAFTSCTRRASMPASPGHFAYILTRPLTGRGAADTGADQTRRNLDRGAILVEVTRFRADRHHPLDARAAQGAHVTGDRWSGLF